MKNFIATAAFTAALTLSGAASAATTTIFEEDFADEVAAEGGVSVLNFTGFDQFSVSDGTVDLIANGNQWGINCGVSGACVDLDGSTSNSGFLSSTVLDFFAGVTYTFKAIISGNQRNGADDTGTFGLTNGFDGVYSLAAGDAFSEFSFSFTAASDSSGSVFFQDDGNDNVGAILDYVSVTADVAPVPLPASALMLIAGLGGLAAMRRRKNVA